MDRGRFLRIFCNKVVFWLYLVMILEKFILVFFLSVYFVEIIFFFNLEFCDVILEVGGFVGD